MVFIQNTNKSWHQYGCACDGCLAAKEQSYVEAFQKYKNNGELSIHFAEWENDDDYGIRLYINGHDCGEVMYHPEEAVARVLEFLNIHAHVVYMPENDDTMLIQ